MNIGKTLGVQKQVGLANQLSQLLDESGYAATLEGYARDFEQSVADVRKQLTAAGISVKLTQADLALIEEVERISVAGLRIKADEFILKLEGEVMNAALSGQTVGETTARLSAMAESELVANHHIQTLADTSITRFNRQMIVKKAEEAGVDKYEYVGLIIETSRDFCRKWIGQILTKDEINALDNGQTSNVMTDGGGFNCMHLWRPVV